MEGKRINRVAVLGSTGSIGISCLEVIGALQDRLTPIGITARRNWQMLSRQSAQFAPRWAVLSDASLRESIPRDAFSKETELLFGPEGIEQLAGAADVDVVVCGIVGAAGLQGTIAALKAGKRVAIANKEPLVAAGPLILEIARSSGATILPVDSEHSAIFQALQSGRHAEVKRIVLTASGGPFHGWTADQLKDVTPEMALAHPTWNMGAKITVDSATLMNKALEIVEAKWLFDLSPDQIEVVIHPQSIVHSFVEFVDSSVIAQLSPPDMKLPIQYALTFPERTESIAPKLDWSQTMDLHFEPPDMENFPALALGFEVARRGGSTGAVLNAANEAAVGRFLSGTLRFSDIPRACRAILEAHKFDAAPTLTDVLRLDRWAREEMHSWKS